MEEKGLFVHLRNFEGDGKPAKVSLKALKEKRETKTIAGKIGKKNPKTIRRNNANGEMVSKMENKSES